MSGRAGLDDERVVAHRRAPVRGRGRRAASCRSGRGTGPARARRARKACSAAPHRIGTVRAGAARGSSVGHRGGAELALELEVRGEHELVLRRVVDVRRPVATPASAATAAIDVPCRPWRATSVRIAPRTAAARSTRVTPRTAASRAATSNGSPVRRSETSHSTSIERSMPSRRRIGRRDRWPAVHPARRVELPAAGRRVGGRPQLRERAVRRGHPGAVGELVEEALAAAAVGGRRRCASAGRCSTGRGGRAGWRPASRRPAAARAARWRSGSWRAWTGRRPSTARSGRPGSGWPDRRGRPMWWAVLVTVTIRPPDAAIAGSSRLVSRKWPRWLTPNCISLPSTVVDSGRPISPALFTSTSIVGWRSTMVADAARTASSDARSSGTTSRSAVRCVGVGWPRRRPPSSSGCGPPARPSRRRRERARRLQPEAAVGAGHHRRAARRGPGCQPSSTSYVNGCSFNFGRHRAT